MNLCRFLPVFSFKILPVFSIKILPVFSIKGNGHFIAREPPNLAIAVMVAIGLVGPSQPHRFARPQKSLRSFGEPPTRLRYNQLRTKQPSRANQPPPTPRKEKKEKKRHLKSSLKVLKKTN